MTTGSLGVTRMKAALCKVATKVILNLFVGHMGNTGQSDEV